MDEQGCPFNTNGVRKFVALFKEEPGTCAWFCDACCSQKPPRLRSYSLASSRDVRMFVCDRLFKPFIAYRTERTRAGPSIETSWNLGNETTATRTGTRSCGCW